MRILKSLVAALAFVACSENGTNGAFIDNSPEKKIDGMIAVRSAGRSVKLESLKAKFDYDFMLGEHEVTCGEVAELADEQWGAFAKCKKSAEKKLPIDSVTFYDAVYFANAKGHAMGEDTVYRYTRAEFDDRGHCVGLEGFSVDYDVDGFRLPTEAEWVLVASKYWNVAESWNSGNSDYETHKVCSKRKESSGFCDLAGNVAEWTNDWFGNLKDTTILNFIGVTNGGAVGERVIKGGSFRNEPAALTYTSRGDVYTVTAATRREYIGFRLAYGRIPDAVGIVPGNGTDGADMTVLMSTQDLKEKTGSYRSKLAFRNNSTGNLAYVDFFSSGTLTAVEIHDTIDSYHPDISPDGSKVAFCTVMEGLDKPSKLYVRNLDSLGSGLVQLDVESAAIPRWRVTAGGDTAIVYVTSAADNADDAEFLGRSTWQVPFKNGKFGAPQKLFDGAYHGGVSLDESAGVKASLAVSGSTRLRARVATSDATSDASVAALDTVWYNAEQACNVSLAQDGTNRTLFLDFASATGRDFVGSKYTMHGRVFLADSTGELIQSVASPKGYTFDHTEWASSNLIIAALANNDGSHEKLALVDITDSTTTPLVEGDDLWHPCLWTRGASPASNPTQGAGSSSGTTNNKLDLDSAGVYLTETHDNYSSIFRVKMEIFWKNILDSRVVIVGSSRARTGVNPDLYPKWKMLNMAVIGVDAFRELSIIEKYVLNHADSLKAIVLSLDLDGWRGNMDFWSHVVTKYPGYVYDMTHNYWASGIPEGFVEAVENAYPAEKSVVEDYSARGGSTLETNSWTIEPVQVYYDSVFSDNEKIALDGYLDQLEYLADLAEKKKVYIVGIIFPQAPQYKKTGSLGLYGLQRSEAKKVIARLDSMAKEKPYFVLMDENKMGDHDYADSAAYNMDHLSSVGAAQLTERLVKKLESLK